jgi:hypothetical protein
VSPAEGHKLLEIGFAIGAAVLVYGHRGLLGVAFDLHKILDQVGAPVKDGNNHHP